MERDYLARRGSVLAMLRADFPSLSEPDRQELYHEAWLEALELRARGTSISSLGGLLHTIAWRRAVDAVRKHSAEPLDPTSRLFEAKGESVPAPDESVQVHLDFAAVRQIVETLEPRHVAVLKLRFEEDLDRRQIQHRLRLSSVMVHKAMNEAYSILEARLQPDGGVPEAWARRQRSLLLACELGLASRKQRERAQRMVDEDPRCAAMLRELRTTLKRVAAALPVPVVLEPNDTRFSLMLDRLQHVLDLGREQLTALLPRLSSQGPTIEQASAGGLASLGAGALAKLGVICVTAVGGTVVCIEANLLPEIKKKPAEGARSQRRPAPTEREPLAVRLASSRKPSSAAPAKPRARQSTASTSANAPEAPSPAPTGSTEFGPGTQGSQPASTVPAAAPSGGGGEFLP